MAQPSVAAYFNTRKRVAIDELKINRARKVLKVGEDEAESKKVVAPLELCSSKIENAETDQLVQPSSESGRTAPNKIIGNSEMVKKTSKNKTRITNTRRRILETKGQQNLQKFVSVIPSENTILANEEPKEKHFTPPPSPVKPQNAMDKVTDKTKDASLNALKLKLSRSNRLAELKASLSRFNESHNKLKEIEKITSNISVSPKQSPVLQNFRSLELEVNLSPQKVQSPEKLYLSPKKDVTARKNLLNLLSPTKNAVALCQSPSKKIQELICKPALALPFKYRYLAEMFRSIDTVCQLMFNRKETITLSRLKPAVEKMTKRNLKTRSLAQIKFIYPKAFEIFQEKLRVFGSEKKEERWDLVVKPLVEEEKITSDTLLNRRRILFDLLLDKVKDYHTEFLKGLDPPMVIPKDKITRWHPEFDIERVPDLEESELPTPPEDKLMSGQEVLEKARQMFGSNLKMEQALERLKAKREEAAETVKDDAPPTSILKGIPKALLEKVRQKQAAKAMILMTRTADKDKELQKYSRLPGIARLMRNLFVSNKKDCMPMDVVIEKLEHSFSITLTENEIKEHIELLSKELPGWLVLLKNSDKRLYVKLDRMADLSIIISKLESCVKSKSDS